MERPQTTQPQLDAIGESLGRSIQLHLVQNNAVRSAFAELAFELELARQLEAPAVFEELFEQTA